MAKDKTSKNVGFSIPHKHLHSRLSFLHQAASYLATADSRTSLEQSNTMVYQANPPTKKDPSRSLNNSTRLLMHLRGVSRKSQIRLAPKVKHSICKRCDNLLIPGKTSTESIVNPSKSGKKVSADVLEIGCSNCGTVKRFPVGTMRDKAKSKSRGAVDSSSFK